MKIFITSLARNKQKRTIFIRFSSYFNNFKYVEQTIANANVQIN